MSFVDELKHRNVIRVAVAYVVSAWVIVEASSLILGIYGSPESVMKILVALLALGLPFVIGFTWAFEVTPEGIRRESDVDRTSFKSSVSSRRLDLLTITMIVAAAGLIVVDRFLPRLDQAPPEMTARPAVADERVTVTQRLLEISRLREAGNYLEAFDLASAVASRSSADSIPEDMWSTFSWSADINSDPAGARVYRQLIIDGDSETEDLGVTPIADARFALEEGYRLRLELDGYRPVEILSDALFDAEWRDFRPMNPVRLDPIDVLPEEMVRVPGFNEDLVEHASYFMDRHETTNRQYQRFVAAGGYENPEYWIHDFVEDGDEIPWEEGVAKFVDRTGRPGPSTWSGGAYPSGLGSFPVGGLSWYEAAAYARFKDKELPTWSHHRNARPKYGRNAWLIASRSNIAETNVAPVGEYQGMTSVGIYDLVGNVREWVLNESGPGMRATAGGAWTDAPFYAERIVPKSPWDRDSTNGVRLMLTFDSDEKLARLHESVVSPSHRNFYDDSPVSDAEFAVFKRMYAYDEQTLNSEVEEVDTFENWRRERVTFDLPSGERGGVYLFLPEDVEPPYQSVIYWPGSGALYYRAIDDFPQSSFDFVIRSGRALAIPMFKGTFDRDDAEFSVSHLSFIDAESRASTAYRDFVIRWIQDLSRTIDYLETREDFLTDRIGFYGYSWGANVAPVVLTVEDERISAAVLAVAGLDGGSLYLPEVDTFNYLGRVRAPVLMINGEYDTVYPYETATKPMFELLGTDREHKSLVITPAAHFVPQDVLIEESLKWFDRYLSGQRK